MSETTELGKISSVKLGFGGYQDVQFGLSLTFEMPGSGVQTFITGENTLLKIEFLLKSAKIDDLQKLKNIPVQITFENSVLKSWRILTEVL